MVCQLNRTFSLYAEQPSACTGWPTSSKNRTIPVPVVMRSPDCVAIGSVRMRRPHRPRLHVHPLHIPADQLRQQRKHPRQLQQLEERLSRNVSLEII